MTHRSDDSVAEPGLSVVIPTTWNRPQLLRRAIDSCLRIRPPTGIEVLVVANGADGLGGQDLGGIAESGAVRLLRVTERNANLARNAGMEAARGEYLRFLDDDDFLEPNVALAQYINICASGADISSGAVRFIDEDGLETGRYTPRESCDFVAEMFWQRPSTLPVAHLFRRQFLAGMQWSPTRAYLQDVDWMHSLVCRGEVRWVAFPEVVGAWCRHSGARTSVEAGRRLGETALRMGISIIQTSIDALDEQGRFHASRRSAAAKALWDYAYQGFSYSPRGWTHVARQALELDPRSRPSSGFFERWPLNRMDPVMAGWLLYPARAVARGLAHGRR